MFNPNDIPAQERHNQDWIQHILYPNLNSAISNYQTDDFFYEGESITLWGYAYTGRGIWIKRVEISIDGGKKWTPVNIWQSIPSIGKPSDSEKCWTWVIWDQEYPTGFSENEVMILVRAWDEMANV